MKIYTGIGSRQTPRNILDLMTKTAKLLASNGWTLRSGGAEGADSAFEAGAGENKEIYLPWKNFNGSQSILYDIKFEAKEIAKKYHPAWNKLNKFGRLFHSRNVYQVLGYDLNLPTKFILCYHEGRGGTLQACRIAEDLQIPIINMINIDWKEQLIKVLKDF